MATIGDPQAEGKSLSRRNGKLEADSKENAVRLVQSGSGEGRLLSRTQGLEGSGALHGCIASEVQPTFNVAFTL